MLNTVVRFAIGGFVLSLNSDSYPQGEILTSSYYPFLSEDTPSLMLKHTMSTVPALDDWELCFDTGGTWKMYTLDGSYAITVTSQAAGSQPFHVATLHPGSNSGEIITNQAYAGGTSARVPLLFPLVELIFTHLLENGHGLIIHACAVKLGESGLLFPGNSGAGKSTLARLWAQVGATTLSDDRVILRMVDGVPRIYGTPWHGDAVSVSAQSAPLRGIYILKQAPDLALQPLRPIELVSQLLARSFPPYWSPSGMSAALDLLSDVSAVVPAYQFGFTPDRAAVEFITDRGGNL